MMNDGPRASAPMPLILVVIISAAVALATLAAGIVAIALSDTRYAAQAKVLIAPVGSSVDAAASSADTLSRGTIVATFGEAYSSSETIDRAFAAAGIPEIDGDRVDMSSSVIAGTSIIRITATSADAALARRAAIAVSDYVPELAGYSTAFRPVQLESPGSAGAAGPSSLSLTFGAVVLALLAGGLTAFALQRSRRRPGHQPETLHRRSPAEGDDEQMLEASTRRS